MADATSQRKRFSVDAKEIRKGHRVELVALTADERLAWLARIEQPSDESMERRVQGAINLLVAMSFVNPAGERMLVLTPETTEAELAPPLRCPEGTEAQYRTVATRLEGAALTLNNLTIEAITCILTLADETRTTQEA